VRQNRVPPQDHRALPWLAHDLLFDYEVEDVWRFPVRLRPGDSLEDLVGEMRAAVAAMPRFGLTSMLFRIRFFVGRLLRWEPTSVAPSQRIRDRLAELRPDVAVGRNNQAAPAGSFVPVYTLPDECLWEIENRTVRAAVHIGRVRRSDGGSFVNLAVYVIANGRLGRIYMRVIAPARRWIVYPALLRAAGHRWAAHVAGTPRPAG